MKVRLISTEASCENGKLKKEYINAFNAKESKGKDWLGDPVYNYETDVSSVEELFRIAKEIQQELVITPKDGLGPDTIEIYDEYRE